SLKCALEHYGMGAAANSRLATLIEAVRCFGFHLTTIDLRQCSDVHCEVVQTMLAHASIVSDYASLSEEKKIEVLVEVLSTPRPVLDAYHTWSDVCERELGVLRM